jgi:5-methylcytosine-specific restriction protein B
VKPSDQVREYCKSSYVDPARRSGFKLVSIRAGDVHRDLKFKNRLPLVCAALGSNVFQEMCQVKRKSIDGPSNGANAIFTFELI